MMGDVQIRPIYSALRAGIPLALRDGDSHGVIGQECVQRRL